jgi:hypothetical protein
LFPFQLRDGLIGRAMKPPPQFGHTLESTVSTQLAQNVHSKLQIRALVALGGRATLQFSQVGLSWSIGVHPFRNSDLGYARKTQ